MPCHIARPVTSRKASLVNHAIVTSSFGSPTWIPTSPRCQPRSSGVRSPVQRVLPAASMPQLLTLTRRRKVVHRPRSEPGHVKGIRDPGREVERWERPARVGVNWPPPTDGAKPGLPDESEAGPESLVAHTGCMRPDAVIVLSCLPSSGRERDD